MIRATRKKSATIRHLKPKELMSRGGASGVVNSISALPRRKQKRAASDHRFAPDAGHAGSDATNGVAGDHALEPVGGRAGRPKKQRVADDENSVAENYDVRGTQTNGAAGEMERDSVRPPAPSATSKGAGREHLAGAVAASAQRPRKPSRAIPKLKTKLGVPGGGSGGERSSDAELACALTCRKLQEQERRYVVLERSRIMIDNRLRASVAQFMGYNAGMEEADRKSYFTTAEAVIKSITGKSACPADYLDAADLVRPLVVATGIASDGYQAELDNLEKAMVKFAKSLPVWSWAEGIRGFGAKSLARIIGESGDLSLYANPAKLWKRFGLAPFKGKMCSTWRRKGGLHADEWSEVGYNPRRRSVVWNVGECLVKLNQTGAYRKRYDEQKAKKVALASEDWKLIRCHNHGKLMAEKLLILDLWKAWRGIGEASTVDEVETAEPAALSV